MKSRQVKESHEEHFIIQISDLHIFNNLEDKFAEVNTCDSLNAVLNQINADHTNIDCLLATGDLVQDPNPQAYNNLIEILSTTPQAIYTLPGNHDDPSLMREYCCQAKIHFQNHLKLGNWGIYFLNSCKPQSHNGLLAKDDLESLDQWLANNSDQHVIICLHHHPVPIGSSWMDEMMLENPIDLFTVLDKYTQIKAIVWGHIHQEFEQVRNSVQLLGAPSTCAQFPPHVEQFEIDSEKPGYRWFRLSADGNLQTGVSRLRNL